MLSLNQLMFAGIIRLELIFFLYYISGYGKPYVCEANICMYINGCGRLYV
jgi:hypothetical protein